MTSLPTTAIAGATGNLGAKLTRAILLPDFQARFKQVIVLSRSDSASAQELVQLGGTLRLYNEHNLKTALEGVDVLVSTVGPSGHVFKAKLLEAIPHTSIKLYIPSEFGVDHYIHDFPAAEWGSKKHHFELVQKLIPNVAVCRIYPGLFLEDSLGPWFGFHTKKGIYEAIGQLDTRTSYTSMHDVGKALAVLASLPIEDIPAEVHLSGDNKSMREIAQIMQDCGAGAVKLREVQLEEHKKKVVAAKPEDLAEYIRFVMGEGKIDHRAGALGNSNELVDPGEKYWKWRTVRDIAEGTKGRPWSNFD